MNKPPILILLLDYPKGGIIDKCFSGLSTPFPPLDAPAIIRVCSRGAQAFSGNVISHNLLNHTYSVKITGPLNDYDPNTIYNESGNV